MLRDEEWEFAYLTGENVIGKLLQTSIKPIKHILQRCRLFFV